MIIHPKVRGFICVTAHPVGCALNVSKQIHYTQQQSAIKNPPKNVLIIGCSTGYGLASRITAAFSGNASTLGVCFEKKGSKKRTGSAGWYNTAAFHHEAKKKNLYAKTLNGDAFSHALKNEIIQTLQTDFIQSGKGPIDLVIYSLASPKRMDPDTGEIYQSTLKPVGTAISSKNFDTSTHVINEMSLPKASQKEIDDTIKVMGGDDWKSWIQVLNEANLLAKNCITTAYTYIGKELTQPIYGQATIGRAKDDLENAASTLNKIHSNIQLKAYITSLKAVVTQASSAIPIMPLYISLMYQVMKDDGCHEGVIEQISTLFREHLFLENPSLDAQSRIRIDGVETNERIQSKIKALWNKVNTDNFKQLGDYVGYHHDFLQLFGFEHTSIDYDKECDPIVSWEN
jgi:enoyl-[acyl-carrier protein] reductase/trans-2-enoyl-CoA reductase (NAD+)